MGEFPIRLHFFILKSWMYMSQLAVFAIAALIIGLFVRKPFMKMNHFVEERMEDTKMM